MMRFATLWIVLSFSFSAAADTSPSSPLLALDGEQGSTSESLPAADRGLARERAERALKRTGSDGDFAADDDARNFARDRLVVRDRAIPRDIPLDRLTGCNRAPKTKPNSGRGCNACNDCESLPSSTSESTSGLLQILLALLLVALIAGLLYRVLLNRRRDFADPLSEHELVLEARGLAEDAVESAAERGDYNVAIHALFLRTLLRISERGVAIRRDWTPREIPQRIALEDRQRSPLRELVALAELARFADHRSSPAEYEQARDAAARLNSPAVAPSGVAASKAGGDK